MNSIENYKIFYHQKEQLNNEEESFEQKVFKECLILFEDHSTQLNHLIYCKKTEEIISHNLKDVKNADIKIDFTLDLF